MEPQGVIWIGFAVNFALFCLNLGIAVWTTNRIARFDRPIRRFVEDAVEEMAVEAGKVRDQAKDLLDAADKHRQRAANYDQQRRKKSQENGEVGPQFTSVEDYKVHLANGGARDPATEKAIGWL